VCPPGSNECKAQPPQEGGEGCGAEDFAYWFKDSVLHPTPSELPPQPSRPMTLAELPAGCRAVLAAPDAKQ
jgi:penicillin-insensitive murein endopeptidase